MGQRGKELTGLAWFGQCIIHLIDEGKKENLKTIQDKMYEGVLVNYILEKYETRFSKENYDINKLNDFFKNQYDCAESRKSGVYGNENGLIDILIPILDETERQITKWD